MPADFVIDSPSGQPVAISFVSGNYFPVIGITPFAGRFLNPDDGKGDAPLSCVASDRFWRERFGNAPFQAGRHIVWNGRSVA